MGIDGRASGMSDENRLGGFGDAVGGGAESGVAGFEASIAEDTAVVVGELHDAHAELAKHFDALGIFLEKRGVLKTGHDSDFGFALGASDVGMAAHDKECFWMLVD